MKVLNFDEQFPISVEYIFQNNFIELADGKTQSIVSWSQPLAEYDISKAFFDEDKLNYLLEFFDEVSAGSFLYLDPCDHFCNDYEYQPSTGIATTGELYPRSDTKFQLCKVYRAGGSNVFRPITRPINDEHFRINSTTSYVVDFNTGEVNFSSPPVEQAIKWQGKFYVPVRLMDNDLSYKIESNTIDYSLPGLRFREIREFQRSFNFEDRFPSLNIELDLDLIVGSMITATKKVSSMSADSGWHKSLPLWTEPRLSWKTAEKTIADNHFVESIIALWRVSCGGAIGFKYLDKYVQVKDTPLSITVESEFNFGIGSLNLIESEGGSFLGNLDGQTYIVPIVDSSGSMNNDIPNVEAAIAELRPLVRDLVYGGNQALADKYFKPIRYIGDERWVEWLARDYRDSTSEPDKVVILAWINESYSVYHDLTVSPTPPPTAAYNSDLAAFLNKNPTRQYFSAVIYAVEHGGSDYIPFRNHLIAAYEGTSGYTPALKDYPVLIRPQVPANSPASFYLEDLTAGGSARSINFICRCWSIEKKQRFSGIEFPDYSQERITPALPQVLSGTYSSHIFGEYESALNNDTYVCGDKIKWRTHEPITGSQFSPVIPSAPLQKYYAIADDTPRPIGIRIRSPIIGITDAQYAERYMGTLSLDNTLGRADGCATTTHQGLPLFGKNPVVLNAVPESGELPPPAPQSDAYFKLGQCSGITYGFKAKYGDNLETIVTGSVVGKITAIRVYLVEQNGVNVYALSVDNESGATQQPIFLETSTGNLTYQEATTGIYQVTAVRLDGLADECGNLYDSPVAETPVTPSSSVGFTNHDCIIGFDGVEFLPNYGGDAQARQHSEDIGTSNNTETSFIFSTEAISREDLLDGAYDGARFTEWIVDWSNPTNRAKLASGYLGRATTYHSHQGGLTFKLEMRSLLARLQQKNYFLTVKLCPKTFGKQKLGDCRKNLFGYIDTLKITQIIDAVSFKVDSTRTVDNFYSQLTFTSGARINITKLIDKYNAATKTITLRNSINNVAVGDTMSAIARCDKTLKSCMDYNNTPNFGGFWHVPGVDKARRTDR